MAKTRPPRPTAPAAPKAVYWPSCGCSTQCGHHLAQRFAQTANQRAPHTLRTVNLTRATSQPLPATPAGKPMPASKKRQVWFQQHGSNAPFAPPASQVRNSVAWDFPTPMPSAKVVRYANLTSVHALSEAIQKLEEAILAARRPLAALKDQLVAAELAEQGSSARTAQ
jgi:hypothetical protein